MSVSYIDGVAMAQENIVCVPAPVTYFVLPFVHGSGAMVALSPEDLRGLVEQPFPAVGQVHQRGG